LKEEEIKMMGTWSEEESRKYVKRFRRYRSDTRCRNCRWFRHMVHYCRRTEIKAEREQRGGLYKNRWEPLRSRVMSCEEDQKAVLSAKREAQQGLKCWGCGKKGHRLWTCPKKAVHPVQGKALSRRLVKFWLNQ